MNTIKGDHLPAQSKFLKHKIVKFFMSAGVAALADFLVYTIIINFFISGSTVNVSGRIFKAHEFSLFISYSIGVIINFTLTKFAVFKASTLKNRQQFSRFVLIAFIGFYANYGLLRFFVEQCGLLPTISRIVSALSLAFASYYVHSFFTFRTNKND